MAKAIHVGTIKGNERIAIGHQAHISGCGAHRNQRNDKKLRRQEDRRQADGRC